jgi:hypothetical protein
MDALETLQFNYLGFTLKREVPHKEKFLSIMDNAVVLEYFEMIGT